MNKAILNLEKRKSRVLKMRNNYMFTCDKETDVYESEIRKFDKVLDNIVKAIRSEWNKFYK